MQFKEDKQTKTKTKKQTNKQIRWMIRIIFVNYNSYYNENNLQSPVEAVSYVPGIIRCKLFLYTTEIYHISLVHATS